MPRSYYNQLLKGLMLPPSTTRKNRSPYALIKNAVKKAKLKHELKEQLRAQEERMAKLQAYRQTSEEFLTKVKTGAVVAEQAAPGPAAANSSDDACPTATMTSTKSSQSRQLAVDCQGKQWTTKPKIINGEMKFTTPRRYLPKRFDSGLAALDERQPSLIVEVPDFEDQCEAAEEAKQMDLEALAAAIVAAGLQEQAAAILAQCQAQASA